MTRVGIRLRVAHGNGHNEPGLVRWVQGLGPRVDSIAVNESQRLTDRLERVPGRRLTVAGHGFTDRRARSTAILTADRRPNLGELTRVVSERLPRYERVAPDRILVASFYSHPLATALGYEGVAHFDLHANAGPRQLHGDDPTAPIVREYRESLDSCRTWARAARRDRLLLVITGDLQVPASHARAWGPRPQLARPLDLLTKAAGIDWILYDRRLVLTAWTPYDLHDHTAFVATLEGDTD